MHGPYVLHGCTDAPTLGGMNIFFLKKRNNALTSNTLFSCFLEYPVKQKKKKKKKRKELERWMDEAKEFISFKACCGDEITNRKCTNHFLSGGNYKMASY
ncbi:hypothetical protein POVWA1_040510 [Plasmodium ovale wallikeri]|uniref:Uncharacterized protein n=1 Tax=Plasmodium ovale wallikeri TaxID=864142 RepID=A0A1A8Z7C3_PLAOA|nr:hypothetical protein POVWA1_040510 [Plasmodium ovale wallikeri]